MDLGITLKEAGARIGVSPQTVRHWELGLFSPSLEGRPALYQFVGFCPADPGGTLGARIRLWRSANGVNQQNLADRLGIDAGSLSRIEAGVVPLARRVVARAKAVFAFSTSR
jgi:transcriptional regulator with XRE-family HTH domain